MPKNIEAPQSLADLLSNPQRVRDAFALLNALANLNVQMTTAQGSTALAPGQKNIRGEPPNLVLALPIKLASPIADSSATAASASAQLNLLLAAMRVTGQLPS